MIHSILHVTLNLLIILMDIFLLIVFIDVITYDYSRFEIFGYIFTKNWSYNLIKSIKIELDSINNQQEYEPLINISFPGITEGCDCRKYNGEIYLDLCSSSSLSKKCENVDSIEGKIFNNLYLPELDIYGEKGVKISIIRYEESFNYLNMINNSNNDNNDDYFINQKCNCQKYSEICYDCGIIDSLGNHLCIISNRFLKYNCFKLNIEYDYTLKDIQLVKDFQNIFDNNNILYPIEFINYFNQTCALQNEIMTSPFIEYNLLNLKKNDSLFLNGPKNQGCLTNLLFNVKNDDNWIDIYAFKLTYFIDKKYKKELSLLPEFPYDEYINSNFSLAYKTYSGFRTNCKKYITFITEDIPLYYLDIKMVFIVFLFISMVIVPYYLLLVMIVVQTGFLSFEQGLIFVGSYSLCIGLYLKYIFDEYNNIENKLNVMIEIANKYCGDNFSNNLFFSIIEDLNIIKYKIQYCIVWTIIILILSLIKIILLISKAYKKKIIFFLNNGNQVPIGVHNNNLITEVEMQLWN